MLFSAYKSDSISPGLAPQRTQNHMATPNKNVNRSSELPSTRIQPMLFTQQGGILDAIRTHRGKTK